MLMATYLGELIRPNFSPLPQSHAFTSRAFCFFSDQLTALMKNQSEEDQAKLLQRCFTRVFHLFLNVSLSKTSAKLRALDEDDGS